jgi:uracil-DNA glycosylase
MTRSVKIHESWMAVLQQEFEQDYFKKLTEFVRTQYTLGKVFPPPGKIFNAFDLCPFDQVKVVILGQDPYHGEGQAHGLAFSVQDGIKAPPSLKNIRKEIQSDLGVPSAFQGSLEGWARQGILLLNTTLTVRAGEAGSHQGQGWEKFTDAVIQAISDKKEDVVFLLWGNHAQKKEALIDAQKHLILKAAHPSPLSAYNGFFGCRHFSQANAHLQKRGERVIVW